MIPFFQRGKGDISIFEGTHPYGQGGNGLGEMFRSLFRTATPFLKTTVKKVGKRMLACSLLVDEEYVNSVTELIPIWAAEGRKELSDDRSVWDWIKYNIRAHACRL